MFTQNIKLMNIKMIMMKLETVKIKLTNRCNADCIMCIKNTEKNIYFKSRGEELTWEALKKKWSEGA